MKLLLPAPPARVRGVALHARVVCCHICLQSGVVMLESLVQKIIKYLSADHTTASYIESMASQGRRAR